MNTNEDRELISYLWSSVFIFGSIRVLEAEKPITSDMHVLIVGAGGHGKVVLDILRACGPRKFTPVAFVDADPSLHGTRVGGVEVFGGPNQLTKLRQRKIR